MMMRHMQEKDDEYERLLQHEIDYDEVKEVPNEKTKSGLPQIGYSNDRSKEVKPKPQWQGQQQME